MAFSPEVQDEARSLHAGGLTPQQVVDTLNKKYQGLMTFKWPTVKNRLRAVKSIPLISHSPVVYSSPIIKESLYTSPSAKDTNASHLHSGHLSGHAGSVVLAIPDLHCPFEHPDALAFLVAVRDKIRPDKVVCLGDEIDAHAYSRWPKDPDGMGAGQELKAAIEGLIPFYVAFPEVQVCVSNHTIRPKKMMKEIGLPAAFWPKYETMLNAPDGWSWHEHIVIDNVLYIHGDQGKGGMNGWTKNSEVYHKSTVVGHWHSKAGVYYDSAMFNVNAGCLINDKAYAFDYAKNSHKKPNLGCAVITRGRKATFMPMLTDASGRWIGEL